MSESQTLQFESARVLQSLYGNDLARLGAESKAVITGDHTQIDLPANKRSGLVEAMGALQTIEGIAPEGQLHPVSAAFVNHDAQQCGYCTPGFVMAAKGFLDKNPNPTSEQVEKGLAGNICRCGTYVGVRKAVLEAAKNYKGGSNA